jgi:hypothetical protein
VALAVLQDRGDGSEVCCLLAVDGTAALAVPAGSGPLQAAAATAWVLILMTVFPFGPARPTQEHWMPTEQSFPAITVTVAAPSFTAATAGLRAVGVARRTLRAQLTGSTAGIIGGRTRAVSGGALGAGCGATAVQVSGALVRWHQLRSALADHHAVAELVR